MAIKMTCPCGKRMAIDKQYIGRKIACPGCGKKFVLDREKIAAMLRSTQKAVAVQAAANAPPPPIPAALDEEPAELDQDILTLIGDGEPMATPPPDPTTNAPSVVLVEDGVDLAYARASSKARSRGESDAIQEARHSFWVDLTLAIVYPVQSIGNALTFVGLSVLALIQYAAAMVGLAGPMMWIGRFTLYGWFCAFYMSVVIDTSAGSSKMPGIHFDGGWWDDVFRPGLLFILAQFIVFAPPALLAWRLDTLMPSLFCLGVTLFLCPMIILLFSLSDTGSLLRIDLIAQTILRTFPAYLLICVLLAMANTVELIGPAATLLDAVGAISLPKNHFLIAPSIGLVIFREILALYMTAVCMRLIGLYYLHFKHKFAFEFE